MGALLPKIVFFVFFVLPVSIFAFILLRIILKSKASYMKGTVIEKKHNQTRDFDSPGKVNDFYYLVVKTTEGKERNVGLSREMWESFAVGDTIQKPKGTLYPIKVRS